MAILRDYFGEANEGDVPSTILVSVHRCSPARLPSWTVWIQAYNSALDRDQLAAEKRLRLLFVSTKAAITGYGGSKLAGGDDRILTMGAHATVVWLRGPSSMVLYVRGYTMPASSESQKGLPLHLSPVLRALLAVESAPSVFPLHSLLLFLLCERSQNKRAT